MEHVLDNPVWNALSSGNSNLVRGNEEAKHFDISVSPFVGLKDNSIDNHKTLYELFPDDRIGIFISPVEAVIPEYWKIVNTLVCVQMVFEDKADFEEPELELVPLTLAHVPQMLALTSLTNPGPFAERTLEFGHYRGIFDGKQLVAMAGQRMQPFSFAEVSAVCTHPDYLGRAYAGTLLKYQVQRMQAAGITPFLHARNTNTRAIKVYENLGFKTRKEMYFYVLHKNKQQEQARFFSCGD